jgi:hypothetical protein
MRYRRPRDFALILAPILFGVVIYAATGQATNDLRERWRADQEDFVARLEESGASSELVAALISHDRTTRFNVVSTFSSIRLTLCSITMVLGVVLADAIVSRNRGQETN